jgi:hypothetical protein
MPATPTAPQQPQHNCNPRPQMSFDLGVANDAKQAFLQYYWYQHLFYGDKHNDVLLTVINRIDQTIFLLEKIMDMLNSSNNSDQWYLEIETYATSFYYIAFSMVGLLDIHCESLEGGELRLQPTSFKSLRSSAGVRDVRNQMLEHPNKKNGYLMWGRVAIDERGGPILKYVEDPISEGKSHPDAGLFVNAKEFYEKLRQCSLTACRR